jgi:hypothetical protein
VVLDFTWHPNLLCWLLKSLHPREDLSLARQVSPRSKYTCCKLLFAAKAYQRIKRAPQQHGSLLILSGTANVNVC